MVAAEVIAFTSDSLGQYLSLSKTYDATATMMALVVCILFIGLFIELIFSALSKRAGRWK